MRRKDLANSNGPGEQLFLKRDLVISSLGPGEKSHPVADDVATSTLLVANNIDDILLYNIIASSSISVLLYRCIGT